MLNMNKYSIVVFAVFFAAAAASCEDDPEYTVDKDAGGSDSGKSADAGTDDNKDAGEGADADADTDTDSDTDTDADADADGDLPDAGPAVEAFVVMPNGPRGLAFASGYLWIARAFMDADNVTKFDPESRVPFDDTTAGHRPAGVLAAAGAVWVTNNSDDPGTVSRINPATAEVDETIEVETKPWGMT